MTSDHGADRSGPGFDAVLRALRSRVGLTQKELAARAGIGVRTVRDLERGHASRPQRSTVDLLADALGLSGRERVDFRAAARGQPVRPPSARPVRLPPAVELIGRDVDVEELAALLVSPLPGGPRGITLVGLAGVGKTSLGLAVAHRAAVDLGVVGGIVVTDVSTVGDVLTAVAAAFGAGRADDLELRLAAVPALVVVDAVERAPDAVAEALTLLLRRIPSLRFLATGRHPVGLPGERVWPLAPLVVPPPQRHPGLDGGLPGDPGPLLADVAGYPAVRLFLDRLARVRRGQVDPEEVGALVALVRRLGGLPLAIELAAARGRVLTIGEILDRYGDRVLDLTGTPGGDATEESVVSLREAVAASYRLLNSAEQQAVRLLSTFQSRWSLELAEAMLGGDPVGDPVHLLDRLLELGLLSARGTGRFRFRLLDVVRDFAAERAAAEGDLTAARHRHAQVLADLVWRIAGELAGRNLADAASRLDEVSGDVGAALGFAAGNDPHTALKIAAALPRWWRFRGRDVTGRQWLRRLLDDPRTADADPVLRGWALVGVGRLALEHGEGAAEIGSAQDALDIFERLGSLPGQLRAHILLSCLWMTTNVRDRAQAAPVPRARARRHGEAALRLAHRNGQIRDMAVAENNLTWHEIRAGDLAAARRRLAAVDRLATRCGEHRLRAVAVATLAEVARLDGRHAEADLLGRRAVSALEEVGDPSHRRRALVTVALARAEVGRFVEAEEIIAELRATAADPVAATEEDAGVSMVLGTVALRRGEFKRAGDLFASAAEAYDGGHDPRDVVEALVGLIASTPDPELRQAAVERLRRLCRWGGITLLPRERTMLTPEDLAQVTAGADRIG